MMANKMGMNSMLADMEADLAQKLGKGTHPITKIVKNLWAAEGTKVGDKVRAAYDWEDKAFKLAKFYKELKKNNMKTDEASLKSAWDKVNEVYVDHTTRLPTAIRNMDKSGIYPFMGYAWRSAPQVAKLVAKHPLKAIMFQTLMGSFGWSQIALMNQMFGYDDEKDPAYSLVYLLCAAFLYSTVFRHKSDGFWGTIVFIIAMAAMMIVPN